MPSNEKIARYVIALDEEGARIEEFARRAEQSSKRAGNAFEQAGTKLKNLGDGFTAAGKKMSTFVTAPIGGLAALATHLGDVQLQAERGLAAALQFAGDTAVGTLDDMKDFARELQGITTVGDETSLKMLQVATSMGLQSESAKTAVQEALGLSKAFGINEETAVRYTAALAEGNTTMLNRYIPTLRDVKDDADRVAKAHELLGNAFGIAVSEAETGLGPWRQVKNLMSDLLEQFGKLILEAVQPLVGHLRDLIGWISGLSDTSKKWILVIGGIAAAIGPVLVVLGTMTSAIGTVVGALGAAGAGTGLLASLGSVVTFLTGPVGIAVAIGGVLMAWKPFRELVVSVGGFLVELAQQGLSLVVSGLQKMWDIASPLVDLVGSLAGVVRDVLGEALSWAATKLSEFTEGLDAMRKGAGELEAATRSASAMESFAQGMVDTWRKFGDEVMPQWIDHAGLTEKKIRELQGGLAILQQKGELTSAEFETFRGLLADAKAGLEDTGGAVDTLNNRVGGAVGLAEALKALGVVTLEDVNTKLDNLQTVIDSGVVPTEQLTGRFNELWEEFDRLGLLTPEVRQRLIEITAGVRDLDAELDKIISEQKLHLVVGDFEDLEGVDVDWPDLLPPASAPALIKETADETFRWDQALTDVFDTIRTGKQWLDNLIGSVTKFIGALIGGQGPLQAFGAALPGIGGLLGSVGGTGGGIAGNILGAFGSGGPLGALLSGGAGVAGAVGAGAAAAGPAFGIGALPATFGPGGVLGAAGAGGTAGGLGGLGGALGALATNPIGWLIGGGLGAFFGIRALMGGPSPEELAGREQRSGFTGDIQALLDPIQKAEVAQQVAGGAAQHWAEQVIGVRDALLAVGRTQQEALSFSDALWKAEKEGPEAVQEVIAGIQPVLDQVQAAMGATGLTMTELRDQAINDAQTMGISVAEAFERIATGVADTAKAGSDAIGEELDNLRLATSQKLADLGRQLEGARGTQRIEIQKAIEDVQRQLAEYEGEAARVLQNTADNAVIAGQTIANSLTTGFGGPAYQPGFTGRSGPGGGPLEIVIRGDGESRLMDEIARSAQVRSDRGRSAAGGY